MLLASIICNDTFSFVITQNPSQSWLRHGKNEQLVLIWGNEKWQTMFYIVDVHQEVQKLCKKSLYLILA